MPDVLIIAGGPYRRLSSTMTTSPGQSPSKPALEFALEELDGNVIQRLRRVVQQCTDHWAVRETGALLTYGTLDVVSSGMAASLLEKLGDAKEPVAMMYRHGAHYNLAQLAVLKTGKFYSNIDPELPEQRQLLIIRNLDTRILLCDSASYPLALALSQQLQSLAVINTDELPLSANIVDVDIQPSDAAFIVYTSGSTGDAQGVLLSHQNILMIARSHGRDFHLVPGDRASQICSLWTAASGSEIFSALLNGATLYPFSLKEGGVFAFLQLAKNEALTTFTGTPILFRTLFGATGKTRKFPAMRLIRLGGDRTSRQDIEIYKRTFEDHCVLRLGYGSSEYLLVTQLFIDKQFSMRGEIAPVGFPMAGCELRLLDQEHREVGRGEFGEIAVISRHLSPGYWRNPVLTQQRFLSAGAGSDLRTYLTRDIGFLDQSGCLHHVGRSDSRVKIYGKMVLMSDVEQGLLAIEGVSEAVVLPFDSGERGTELAAFVVLQGQAMKVMDEAALRRLLLEKLAPEVIPRRITLLDQMPLQLNNKINRLELQRLARERITTA